MKDKNGELLIDNDMVKFRDSVKDPWNLLTIIPTLEVIKITVNDNLEKLDYKNLTIEKKSIIFNHILKIIENITK